MDYTDSPAGRDMSHAEALKHQRAMHDSLCLRFEMALNRISDLERVVGIPPPLGPGVGPSLSAANPNRV